jgi:hypothetical protein
MRTRPFEVALLALLLIAAAHPALAQGTTGALTTLFTEWEDWLIGVAAVFFLLVGLIVAWIVAWRSLLGGIVIALAVLALGAVAGNYDAIAGAIGLG